MALGKLVLMVLSMLSLSITFTESQLANETMPLFVTQSTTSPSPTPQQHDGLNSSPVEILLLPISTSSTNQHSIPTSNIVVLQSSNNPTSSSSFQAADSSLSILPSKSTSIPILLSTSIPKTTLVSSEILVVSTSFPTPVPESTHIFMTPPISTIVTTSLSHVAPSTMYISSPVDLSISQSFSTTTVDGAPPPSSSINSISSIVMTDSDLEMAVTSTSARMLVTISSISLTPTVMPTTSPPISMETTMITILRTTTEDNTIIVDETTKEEDNLITRSGGGAGISTPAVIGMVVAACLALIATALLILLLCYCFCRNRKYEYNTGNEYRVTVQKWNTYYVHYTANQRQGDSVSLSSLGSSIMSSFGYRSSNGKTKPRYGGVYTSTDHIHSGATAEMYSTPL